MEIINVMAMNLKRKMINLIKIWMDHSFPMILMIELKMTCLMRVTQTQWRQIHQLMEHVREREKRYRGRIEVKDEIH